MAKTHAEKERVDILRNRIRDNVAEIGNLVRDKSNIRKRYQNYINGTVNRNQKAVYRNQRTVELIQIDRQIEAKRNEIEYLRNQAKHIEDIARARRK